MSISIAHICIRTRDLPKPDAFYCDMLGLKRVFDPANALGGPAWLTGAASGASGGAP